MHNNLNFNKILIRGVNWIGDAVMTMPAIRSIRDNFNGSHISLLVKSWVSELFKHDPNINEIIEYRNEYKGFIGKFRAAKDIKKLHFDYAILLQNALDAALISFLSGIRERIGYNRDGRGIFLTKPVRPGSDTLKLHHIDYYLHLLNQAGLESGYRLPWIYPDINARLKSRETLSQLRQPVVGLNPGAAYGSAKRWHSERFAGVAGRIIKELNGSVVIFGSEKEHPISIEIINNIEKDFVSEETLLNLSGKTSLFELSNLIAECDLLVSNDSGPMHICYATGTPLVALFGSTSPDLTGPPAGSFEGAEFGYAFRVLRADTECSPCFERTCRYGHLECMDRIGADDVFQAVSEVLPGNKAVFFDRDGTLCRDVNYLSSFDGLEIFPEIAECRELKAKGFMLIGITNQSGIARGIVDENFVKKVNRLFIEKFGFDDFYYCPHHPDERCACRKPMPGMLLKARSDHGINLKKSCYIGDKESDMQAAKTAGAKAIHITTATRDNIDYSDMKGYNLKECVSSIINDNR
ncbi:ADP-heptose--LPS heptosyltransferase 2 [bacterium BMS3Abin07]|nr:ADP-heptose--LPS heptosyltransferase 2 [bacterium BMS3Abin07]GBE31285.1 ADP-heptose--LPS heptosyltransferase 2 [bacterium BMS3Bbin05]HDL20651.1 lipopolysaccharide heptosyltransferase II [Nitrospirota bacterium]HDO21336.1 lipopolysaccharide heptosyltransferase II [Nitrospirota bacterium]HDZ87403.1 lipopolysaccharide heptosyltransferase II [Nitrospirota bacterium]